MVNNNMRSKPKKRVCFLHMDWKKHLFPFREYEDAPEVSRKIISILNYVLLSVFIFTALVVGISRYPNIHEMIASPLLVIIIYVGTCHIASSIQFRYSRRGRKPKTVKLSFEQFFLDPDEFSIVDSYMNNTYSTNNKMNSSQCHTLLKVLIEGGHLKEKHEAPIAKAFIVKYRSFLSFGEQRAVTKAKVYSGEQPNLEKQLFQNSSK